MLLAFSYTKTKGPTPLPTPTLVPVPVPDPVDSFFAKGADVSWVTQMELEGIKFYNTNGGQPDLFQILKDGGMNSIRLRVWVKPANGWCNATDVLAKELRTKALGMKIIIDFHYGDSILSQFYI